MVTVFDLSLPLLWRGILWMRGSGERLQVMAGEVVDKSEIFNKSFIG